MRPGSLRQKILFSAFIPLVIITCAIVGVLLQLNEKQNTLRTILGAAAVLGGLTSLWVFVISKSLHKQLLKISEQLKAIGHTVIQNSLTVSDLSEHSLTENKQAASSLESTSTAVTEISQAVNANAGISKRASTLTKDCFQISQQAVQEIRQVTEVMAQLAQKTTEIHEITSVIDDIAFQTNLLALNAAVEAARAGEQGRGFGVVADAVRNLAQKTSESAKNISTLIDSSTQEIRKVSETARTSEESFSKVSRTIESVLQLNDEVASANSTQANRIEQINQSIHLLDNSAQSNSHTASEVSKNAAQMSKESERLDEVILSLSEVLNGAGNEDPHRGLQVLKTTLLKYGKPQVKGISREIGEEFPNIMFGNLRMVGNFEVLDQVKMRMGGTATIFVKKGSDFYRVSTNILKKDGGRAVGTPLAKGAAFEALSRGETFVGKVKIMDADYDTIYEPIFVDHQVIGAYYFGYKLKIH